MKYQGIRKVHEGKFITRYDVDYVTSEGNSKTSEMISRNRNIQTLDELQNRKPDSVIMILTDMSGERILVNWDRIRAIIGELPSSEELEAYMKSIGHPTSFGEIGVSAEDADWAFRMAKDIRDKYVLGRLLWELGMPDGIPS